jgi:3-oxoacyl-[acyl-carrier protein] reductase
MPGRGTIVIDTGLGGRVALVTGGNHGVGAATARALSAQGAAVFVAYLRSPVEEAALSEVEEASVPGLAYYRARQAMPAEWVLASIREAGGRAATLEADLADPSSVPRIFDEAEATLGPVEVLVNNAAYCVPDTFVPSGGLNAGDRSPSGTAMQPLTPEGHDRHFAVNTRAPALMMAEFARRHVERGASWGRIVNVSTDGAYVFPGEVSYGASKLALEGYGRSAAVEVGPLGITVNTVSLGAVQTGWISPEMEEEISAEYPLGRIGQPEDVADVIVFFASEQARWVTAQTLYVGGGHEM